jgi:hypothetical protein
MSSLFESRPLLCVARTSLGDAIKQHLPCYFFQLRMTCNKAWEWIGPPLDLAFDCNKRQLRIGGIDSSISVPEWQRAGISEVKTKETAGMLALETSTL